MQASIEIRGLTLNNAGNKKGAYLWIALPFVAYFNFVFIPFHLGSEHHIDGHAHPIAVEDHVHDHADHEHVADSSSHKQDQHSDHSSDEHATHYLNNSKKQDKGSFHVAFVTISDPTPAISLHESNGSVYGTNRSPYRRFVTGKANPRAPPALLV